MSTFRKGHKVQFRVARWEGRNAKFLAVDHNYMPWAYTREQILDALAADFTARHGIEPNERRIIQYLEGDVTDKELAGLLMEQEHDLTECDSDSECTDGTCCVQVPPRDAD